MVSRKSHPKSRNGCAQCKRRRIKCDEVRPQCSNCLKHEIECDFSTNPPKPTLTPPHVTRTASAGTKGTRRSSSGFSATVHDAVEEGYTNGTGQELAPLHLEELELLHHFTTDTFMTLSDRAESHEIWRVTVPQIAFEHEYLMRGILAISALHLSHVRPAMHDHYTKIAIQQQDSALKSFRTIMTEPHKGNCDAFFAMSSLIVVYGFESPKASNSLGMFNYEGRHSDEWLPLIRGVNTVIQSVYQDVKKGRLNGLLHDHNQSPNSQDLPVALNDQLGLLEQFLSNMSGGEEDTAACKQAVQQLRWCFVRMHNKAPFECEVSLAFLWPVMIPPHFVSLLNERKSEALVVLAHYCINLHHLDHYWWMRGWANHIIDNIQSEFDASTQFWISWPRNLLHRYESASTSNEDAQMYGLDGADDSGPPLAKPLSGTKDRMQSTSSNSEDTRRSS